MASGVDLGLSSVLITAAELARSWGVADSTVYRWASAGVIPSLRIGGTVRFDPDAVRAALEAKKVDPIRERNNETRKRAMKKAEETIVFEIPNVHGACVVVCHPGQKLDRDNPDFEVELMRTFGCRPDQLKLLSESWAAPTVPSIDAEIERARAEVARLESAKADRERIEAGILSNAQAEVDELETERVADGFTAEGSALTGDDAAPSAGAERAEKAGSSTSASTKAPGAK
jgi:excisionase family DNA binding protein